MIEEYIQCSDICAAVDYSDEETVKQGNRAISRMYEIVQQIAAEGPDALENLIVLLDDPKASKWLSHQLVRKS